jgi:excinuclease ABC subunit B
LDIPEVELVAILDADKEGLFRSERSLIQTIGRASRNENARVIMYANTMTPSMNGAITETNRRRTLQTEYNKQHNITPKTVYSEIKNSLYVTNNAAKDIKKMSKQERRNEIEKLTALMNIASGSLDFESAIKFREQIAHIKSRSNI